MAASKRIKVNLASTESSFLYITTINPQNTEMKELKLKRYDPILRKHVLFKAKKVKK